MKAYRKIDARFVISGYKSIINDLSCVKVNQRSFEVT